MDTAVESAVLLLPEGAYFSRVEQVVRETWKSRAAITRLPLGQITPEQIQHHRNAIEAAGVVLADVTGRHPLVMFWLGMSASIGKPIGCFAAQNDEIPFFPRGLGQCVYAGNMDILRQELQSLWHSWKEGFAIWPEAGSAPVSRALQEPSEARSKFDRIFGEIFARHQFVHSGAVEQENPQTFILKDQELPLALVEDLAKKARQLGLRVKLM